MKRKGNKKSDIIIVFALSMYIIEGTMSGINPIMADMVEHFSDYPVSAVMMISTLVPLLAILSGFLAGPLINVLGYKKTFLGGIITYLLGGIMPYFAFSSFPGVLGGRVLVGIGYGILIPAGATIIVSFVEKGKQGYVIGIASIVGSLSGIIYSIVSSMLLMRSVKSAFLVHILMAVPLMILIFIPDSCFQKNRAGRGKQKEESTSKIKVKFGWRSWFWQIFAALNTLFQYIFSLYTSFVVAGLGGNAGHSSVTTSISLVGGCAAGGMFGGILKKLGKYVVPVCALFSAMGYYLIFCAENLLFLYVAAFLVGFCSRILTNNLYIMLGRVTPEIKVAAANGNTLAIMNATAFAASYFFTFVLKVFNKSLNYQFTFIFSAIYFVIVAIVFIVAGKKFRK